MMVQISPTAYITLCALIRDAMQVDNDATPVLKRVADELALGTLDKLPEEITSNPRMVEALVNAGFIKQAA